VVRLRLAAAALALAAGAAGCGGDGSAEPGEATLTIYVSAPLTGPGRDEGQAVADGARKALADAGSEAAGYEIAAEYLDAAGRNGTSFDPVVAAANARTATENSTTIAYVGELESGGTRASLPITNSAGILQVAPGSGATDLVRDEAYNDDVPSEAQGTGERTYAQLVPTYEPGERPEPADPADLGYEAMASILAAVERADDPADRGSVVNAYLGGAERDSVLGRYRITDTGEFEPVD
jgi:branched-chain amino acid transport system substrate-binding protein